MTTMNKAMALAVMVVVPGGLVVMAAFVLARVISLRMRELQGPQTSRLARAVASVRWNEVVREVRRSL